MGPPKSKYVDQKSLLNTLTVVLDRALSLITIWTKQFCLPVYMLYNLTLVNQLYGGARVRERGVRERGERKALGISNLRGEFF